MEGGMELLPDTWCDFDAGLVDDGGGDVEEQHAVGLKAWSSHCDGSGMAPGPEPQI